MKQPNSRQIEAELSGYAAVRARSKEALRAKHPLTERSDQDREIAERMRDLSEKAGRVLDLLAGDDGTALVAAAIRLEVASFEVNALIQAYRGIQEEVLPSAQ